MGNKCFHEETLEERSTRLKKRSGRFTAHVRDDGASSSGDDTASEARKAQPSPFVDAAQANRDRRQAKLAQRQEKYKRSKFLESEVSLSMSQSAHVVFVAKLTDPGSPSVLRAGCVRAPPDLLDVERCATPPQLNVSDEEQHEAHHDEDAYDEDCDDEGLTMAVPGGWQQERPSQESDAAPVAPWSGLPHVPSEAQQANEHASDTCSCSSPCETSSELAPKQTTPRVVYLPVIDGEETLQTQKGQKKKKKVFD